MKNVFRKMISATFLSVILLSPIFAPMTALARGKKANHHAETKVNVKLKVNKVEYVEQHGKTLAKITGRAIDRDSRGEEMRIMYFFESKTDNRLDGFITEGITDANGDYWMLFDPASRKGKVTVCAHDNQAGEYKCKKTKVKMPKN